MAVVLPLTVVVEEVPTEVAMAAATATHLVPVASHPGGKPNKNTGRPLRSTHGSLHLRTNHPAAQSHGNPRTAFHILSTSFLCMLTFPLAALIILCSGLATPAFKARNLAFSSEMSLSGRCPFSAHHRQRCLDTLPYRSNSLLAP